jgi:hypothetical protein
MSVRSSVAQRCGTCNKWNGVGANMGMCGYIPPPVLEKLFSALNGAPNPIVAKAKYEAAASLTEINRYCSEWEPKS